MKLFQKLFVSFYFWFINHRLKFRNDIIKLISNRIFLIVIKQFPELQYEEVQKISYKLYLSVLDENETIDLEDDYYDLIEHVENDTEIHKLLITYDYFRYFIFKKS
ncbi:hypothetical protein D9981_21460 [Pseudoalteromonas phenolica O-BC30]|nr:hypothetical protein D9981_21460 [Pseudoalteromonas phenolica O-BC30]